MRSKGVLVALAIGTGVVLSSGAARAGLPALVVHRTADSSDCPDARALAALVERQMKRPALQPLADSPEGPDQGLDVQIYRSEAGYTAVVQAAGKTRQFSDLGAECGGLSAALAVSIAILLDTEPLPPAPDPPPAPVAPEAPAPPPAPLPPPPPDRFVEPRPFQLTVGAGPVLTDGVLKPFAGGFSGELELRVGRFSIAAGALVLPGQTFDYRGGTVSISLTAGLLRGCATVLGDGDTSRVALCLAPVVGALHGTGQGYRKDAASTLPWAAAGVGALFHRRIAGPFAFGARAELLVPLAKKSFLVDHVGTAFSSAPVGGALDAELRVTIW